MSETIEVVLPIKRRGRPPKIALNEIANSALNMIGEQERKSDRPDWYDGEIKPPMPLRYDLPEKIAHWAYRLELANAMKAGLMDSESRHDEVARQKAAIIESVITEMRAL